MASSARGFAKIALSVGLGATGGYFLAFESLQDRIIKPPTFGNLKVPRKSPEPLGKDNKQ
jgi:hypothetical protein